MEEKNNLKKTISRKSTKELINEITGNSLVKSYIDRINQSDFSLVNVKTVDASEHQVLYLFILNDLHLGSYSSAIEKCALYLEIAKFIPNCKIILNGDILNNAVINSKSNPFENALSPSDEKQTLVQLLSDPKIREKIIDVHPGNHEAGERSKESDSDALKLPAAMLNLLDRYSDYLSLLNLKIKDRTDSTKLANCLTLVRHGSGPGGARGRELDKKVALLQEYGLVDLIIEGHKHVSSFGKIVRHLQTNKKSIRKEVTVVSQAPLQGMDYYAAEAGYALPNTDQYFLKIQSRDNIIDMNTFGENRVPKNKIVIEQVYPARPDVLQSMIHSKKDSIEFEEKKNAEVKKFLTNIERIKDDEELEEDNQLNIFDKSFMPIKKKNTTKITHSKKNSKDKINLAEEGKDNGGR